MFRPRRRIPRGEGRGNPLGEGVMLYGTSAFWSQRAGASLTFATASALARSVTWLS